MDRALVRRALAVGLICFLPSLVGFYLIFSWESRGYSQIPVIYDGPYPNRDPFAGGDIFLTVTLAIIVELALLPVLAGSVAAIALPVRTVAKNELSKYLGLAGAMPLALVSIIFWAVFIAGLVQGIMVSGGPWIPGQIWNYLLGMGINVLIILAGAFISVIVGQCVATVRRWITKSR